MRGRFSLLSGAKSWTLAIDRSSSVTKEGNKETDEKAVQNFPEPDIRNIVGF